MNSHNQNLIKEIYFKNEISCKEFLELNFPKKFKYHIDNNWNYNGKQYLFNMTKIQLTTKNRIFLIRGENQTITVIRLPWDVLVVSDIKE